MAAKRRTMTFAEQKWVWDNKPHTCHICMRTVTKISEAEFDHRRAYSRGGATTPANAEITHRACNRLKAAKTTSAIQKHLGTKTKPKPNILGLFGDPAPKPVNRKGKPGKAGLDDWGTFRL